MVTLYHNLVIFVISEVVLPQFTDAQVAKWVAIGSGAGIAIGMVVTKVVEAIIKLRRSKGEISAESDQARQNKAQADFDFQTRIDQSVIKAHKSLIRDQDARIKKLEEKVDGLEKESDQYRKDYQTVLADNIAHGRQIVEYIRYIRVLEDRLKGCEKAMTDGGVKFAPFFFPGLGEQERKPPQEECGENDRS